METVLMVTMEMANTEVTPSKVFQTRDQTT